MKNLLALDLKPRDIMTRQAFLNAIAIVMILGGSTNSVLHLLAIARSCEVELSVKDFSDIAAKTPFLADLKPSGKYMQEDFHKIGGLPALLKYLIKKGVIMGDTMTVTGKTLGENVADAVDLETTWDTQDVIRPLDKPIKSTGHIAILRGNLAPDTAVA